MKRVLFSFGAFIITHCAWSMEWGSKKGYEKIPSPQEQQNPYCYLDTCQRDEQAAEDARTLENLKDLQKTLRTQGNIQGHTQIVTSSVYVEVMLEDHKSQLMARDTKVCELSDDISDDNSDPLSIALSAPSQSNNQDSKKPAITIQHVAFNESSAIVQYYLNTGHEKTTRTAEVIFNLPDKKPLDNGLIVTIAAHLASSSAATRK